MEVSFPKGNITIGDQYVTAGSRYIWDGKRWVSSGAAYGGAGAPGPQGEVGPQGPEGPAGAPGVTGQSGLFVPSWVSGFSSTTLLNQDGYYYKIDKFVHFSLKLGFGSQAAFKSNPEALRIGGLPFAASSEVSYMGGCTMCKNNYGNAFDNVLISIEPGTTEISFYTNFSPILADAFSHNFKYMSISGNYMTD